MFSPRFIFPSTQAPAGSVFNPLKGCLGIRWSTFQRLCLTFFWHILTSDRWHIFYHPHCHWTPNPGTISACELPSSYSMSEPILFSDVSICRARRANLWRTYLFRTWRQKWFPCESWHGVCFPCITLCLCLSGSDLVTIRRLPGLNWACG